jgi:hypothetical protein
MSSSPAGENAARSERRGRPKEKHQTIPGLPPLLALAPIAGLQGSRRAHLGISGLPPAHEALRAFPKILTDKESLLNILDSMRRMLIGFSLALIVAVPIGLMMGRARLVAAFFNPLLMIIYPVPKAALMPIVMLWLGVGEPKTPRRQDLSRHQGRARWRRRCLSAAAMGLARGAVAHRVSRRP